MGLYGESWDNRHGYELFVPTSTPKCLKPHQQSSVVLLLYFQMDSSQTSGHRVQYPKRLQITFTFEGEITFIDLH